MPKKAPTLQGIQLTIANRIKAVLCSKLTTLFKYSTQFKFNVPNSMVVDNKIPQTIKKYDEFQKHFPDSWVMKESSNSNKNMTYKKITVRIRSGLSAAQVCTIYERTIGLLNLVQDAEKYGLEYSRIEPNLLELKKVKTCIEYEQKNDVKNESSKVNNLCEHLKKSLEHFKHEYIKRCSPFINNASTTTSKRSIEETTTENTVQAQIKKRKTNDGKTVSIELSAENKIIVTKKISMMKITIMFMHQTKIVILKLQMTVLQKQFQKQRQTPQMMIQELI
eukprot:340935_1